MGNMNAFAVGFYSTRNFRCGLSRVEWVVEVRHAVGCWSPCLCPKSSHEGPEQGCHVFQYTLPSATVARAVADAALALLMPEDADGALPAISPVEFNQKMYPLADRLIAEWDAANVEGNGGGEGT